MNHNKQNCLIRNQGLENVDMFEWLFRLMLIMRECFEFSRASEFTPHVNARQSTSN